VDALIEFAIGLAVAVMLCAFAYRKHLMTASASIAAIIGSAIIVFCGGIFWEIAMLLFPISAFIATKHRIGEKTDLGLQEGSSGERHLLNIIGVFMVPTMISVVYYLTDTAGFELTVAYLSALAVSTADTLSSELGVRDPKVYLITTGKPCERGTNGGVSRYGLTVSTIGAFVFALVAYVLVTGGFDIRFIIPFAAGALGNLIDSVEGAVFENRGLMSKYTVNASSALIGAIIGFLLALVF